MTRKPVIVAADQEGVRSTSTTAEGNATLEQPCPSEVLLPFVAALFSHAEEEEREEDVTGICQAGRPQCAHK